MSLDSFEIGEQIDLWVMKNGFKEQTHLICTNTIMDIIKRNKHTFPLDIQAFIDNINATHLDLWFCYGLLSLKQTEQPAQIKIAFEFDFIDELEDSDEAHYLYKHYHPLVTYSESIWENTAGHVGYLDKTLKHPKSLILDEQIQLECQTFLDLIEKEVKEHDMLRKTYQCCLEHIPYRVEQGRTTQRDFPEMVANWPQYKTEELRISLGKIEQYFDRSFCNERYPSIRWNLDWQNPNSKNRIHIGYFNAWCHPNGDVDISFIEPTELILL